MTITHIEGLTGVDGAGVSLSARPNVDGAFELAGRFFCGVRSSATLPNAERAGGIRLSCWAGGTSATEAPDFFESGEDCTELVALATLSIAARARVEYCSDSLLRK